MFVRINVAGKTATLSTFTLNLDTPIRHNIPESDIRFDVNGIPADCDEGYARVHFVCTGNVRRPITNWLVLGSPDTRFFRVDTWRVDVKAIFELVGLIYFNFG